MPGCMEAPNWGVSLRKGHHEPLITFAIHERIQARLKRRMRQRAKDINEDFPLRGFVLCDGCERAYDLLLVEGAQATLPLLSLRHEGLRLQAQVNQACRYRGRRRSASARPATRQAALQARQGHLHRHLGMRRTRRIAARTTIETQLAETSKQIDACWWSGSWMRPALSGSELMRGGSMSWSARRSIARTGRANRCRHKGRLSEFIEPALAFLANPWNIYQQMAVSPSSERCSNWPSRSP